MKGVGRERVYPLPTIRRDFDFDKKICNPNYQEAFEREADWNKVKIWLSMQISIISETFSNADVVIVLPSEFYDKTYVQNIDISYQQKLRSFIQSNFSRNVSFLAQPPYTEKSITCDARHHANSVGRAWRTKNLSDF